MSNLATTQSKSLEINTINDLQQLAKIFVGSGLCKNLRDVAQTSTIILAGRELGLAPFAAVSQLEIINGKPVMTSNLMAQLIKSHPKYNYKVKTLTDELCEVEVYELWGDKWESIGVSSFTVEEAKKANLFKNAVWREYTKDMLFARAISRALRQHAPDAAQGLGIYEINEMKHALKTEETSEPNSDFNGKTHWVVPDISNPEQAFEWCQAVLGVDLKTAKQIYADTPADEKGKKGRNFVMLVRSHWEAGGYTPPKEKPDVVEGEIEEPTDVETSST